MSRGRTRRHCSAGMVGLVGRSLVARCALRSRPEAVLRGFSICALANFVGMPNEGHLGQGHRAICRSHSQF